MSNLNVMLLGKTGVGKSSLLNYLADLAENEKVKTGVGESQTKKGEFNEYKAYSNYLHLNIIDSWGLEVDKQNEWFEVIQTEIKRRDETITKDDDIHAFIYVVNILTGRLEDQEEKIIENILTQISSHLVVVLSKSQNITDEQYNDIKERLAKIKDKVAFETKNDNIDCELIKINSVAKNGFGKNIPAYGKEELLKALADIAWGSLVDFNLQESENQKEIIKMISKKLYITERDDTAHSWANTITDYKEQRELMNKKVSSKDFIAHYEKHLPTRIKKLLTDKIKEQTENFNSEINNRIKDIYNNLLETYKNMHKNIIYSSPIKPNVDIDYIINEFIAYGELSISHANISHGFVDSFLDLFGWGSYTKDMRSFLNKLEDKIRDKAKDVIDEYNKHIEEEIRNITPKIQQKIKHTLLDNHPVRDHFEAGLTHLNRNQYERAIQAFSKVIELNPKNELAYQYRGIAYENIEKYHEAIEDYNETLSINSNNKHAKERKYIAMYAEVDKQQSTNKFAGYFSIGLTHLNNKEYDIAIQIFNKAIELAPGNGLAYQSRGSAYEYKGDYKNAIKDYDTALSLNPHDTGTYNKRYNVMQKYNQ